jgi:hypothetical protein
MLVTEKLELVSETKYSPQFSVPSLLPKEKSSFSFVFQYGNQIFLCKIASCTRYFLDSMSSVLCHSAKN